MPRGWRLALPERQQVAVGAGHRERLPHDQLDVALGHVERHEARVTLQDQIERRFLGRLAGRLRHLRQRLPFECRVRGVLRDDELVGPAAPLEVAADVGGEPVVFRPGDPLQQLRASACFGPARNQRADDAGAARVVRILICPDLDTAVAGLPDALDERHRQTPAGRPQRLHVGDDAGNVRFLGDPDHLLHGGDHADRVVRLVSDVALVDAAHRAHDLRQRDHLLGRRVAARRVVQPRGEPDAPRLHPVPGHRLHAVKLVGRGCAVGHPEHCAPNRAVRHVEGDVDADAALLESGPLGSQVGRAAAVRVQRNGRQALREELPAVLQTATQALRRVRVDVDEPGRDGQPGRVDRARGRRIAEASDLDDAAGADADIGGNPGITATVEDAAVADEDVVG